MIYTHGGKAMITISDYIEFTGNFTDPCPVCECGDQTVTLDHQEMPEHSGRLGYAIVGVVCAECGGEMKLTADEEREARNRYEADRQYKSREYKYNQDRGEA